MRRRLEGGSHCFQANGDASGTVPFRARGCHLVLRSRDAEASPRLLLLLAQAQDNREPASRTRSRGTFCGLISRYSHLAGILSCVCTLRL